VMIRRIGTEPIPVLQPDEVTRLPRVRLQLLVLCLCLQLPLWIVAIIDLLACLVGRLEKGTKGEIARVVSGVKALADNF